MFSDDDNARLVAWLAAEVEPTVSAVEVTRLLGGHSSGAWRLDLTSERPVGPLVLKAPEEPSIVYRRDACREARILDHLGRMGAPVPAMAAIDGTGEVVGRPCFVMEFVEGRTVEDNHPGGFHATEWLRRAGAGDQRAVWDAFHDALAALHRVDPAMVPDARLVNALITGTQVRALVDFEVAYVGNPAADVGYHLFMSASQRAGAESPLPGIPTPEETWEHWSRATGRPIEHRDYWTAFGAMILGVTATRAMVQWGLAGSTIDDDNPIVARWEAAVEQAGGR